MNRKKKSAKKIRIPSERKILTELNENFTEIYKESPLDAVNRITEELIQSRKAPEQINHPSHYGGDVPYEVIKVLEAWEEMFPKTDFKILTAICYLPRAGVKNPETEIQDLEKAVWYIQRKIDQLKVKQNGH
jgi:hypothetical protein